MDEIEINGWRIFLHPCFLDQYDALLAEVEVAKARDSENYRKRACTKMLAAVYRLAFETIPDDPARPEYRLGDTLGKQHALVPRQILPAVPLVLPLSGQCQDHRHRLGQRRRQQTRLWIEDRRLRRLRQDAGAQTPAR
jgi:hypothetical protein